MARKFDDDELDRLKRNISIEAVCREHGIQLKPHGSRDIIGKCPFHEDKNPSFVVSPEKNLFHCLGCDAGGSVIDLVMKLDHLNFKEAVQKLLASTHLVRPASEQACPAKLAERSRVPPERARQLLERVIAIYEKTFAETPEGRKYLEGRGITDAGLFTQHRIGYSNGRLTEILPSPTAAPTLRRELLDLGIFLDNGQERFTGCVVFPVYDEEDNLVTLYGRFTGEGPKRHVFLPDRPTGLWNAAAVKTYSEIILVESVMDALSVMMVGHRNVLAIQGTNGFDEADIQTLHTHGVQAVTLFLDGDDAGRKATERLKGKLALSKPVVSGAEPVEGLSSSFSCRALALPDGEDPNSFLRKYGAEKLAQFISEGQDTAVDSTRAKGETLSGLPNPGLLLLLIRVNPCHPWCSLRL